MLKYRCIKSNLVYTSVVQNTNTNENFTRSLIFLNVSKDFMKVFLDGVLFLKKSCRTSDSTFTENWATTNSLCKT